MVKYWPIDGKIVDILAGSKTVPFQPFSYQNDKLNNKLSAIKFEGAGYASIESGLYLEKEFTITFWSSLQTWETGWVHMMHFSNNVTNKQVNVVGLNLKDTANPFFVFLTNATGVGALKDTQTTVVSNQLKGWNHFALTMSRDYSTLYINGITSGAQKNDYLYSGVVTSINYLAKSPYGGPFHGTMDEIKIYNRVLSSKEIAGDMNNKQFFKKV